MEWKKLSESLPGYAVNGGDMTLEMKSIVTIVTTKEVASILADLTPLIKIGSRVILFVALLRPSGLLLPVFLIVLLQVNQGDHFSGRGGSLWQPRRIGMTGRSRGLSFRRD